MSSNSTFGKSLQFITSIKLQELEKQRSAYQEHLHKSLQKAKSIDDPKRRAEHLLESVTSWKGSGATDETDNIGEGSLNLSNLKMWLLMCDNDPSFSKDKVRQWNELLEEHLQRNSLRFDCAKLFGEMLNEWIGSGDSATAAYQDTAQPSARAEASDAFIDVGRKELHEQREKFESLVFKEEKTDAKALKTFLESLFSDKQGTTALQEIRDAIKEGADEIRETEFTAYTVKATINNLVASDPLNEDQQATLKSFSDNTMILEELAGVLNMRLASIGSWTWPKEGIPVEMRRHLNGKYRFHTDPDTVDAILLHHLGISWQIKFKAACRKLYMSKAWKKLVPPILSVERERYQEQLPHENANISIDARRNARIVSSFFLSQLADSINDVNDYDGDSGEEYGQKAGDGKRDLLHMMLAECYFHTAVDKSFAIIRSDLEWFGPSIPHDTILTVLEFFGVPDDWLGFFKTFLHAPLYFKGEPDNVRIRQRGTPIGYSLSTICGEAILFAMDLVVNQKTGGCFLYRIHDDIFLWDAKPERCATGWAEMQKFASLTGLTFNMSKTGSAVVGDGDTTGLPAGDVRWGFLLFDPSKVRFVIDQKDIDLHISELRRQLNATKSVFGWVNVLNKYMAFFLRNFGGAPTYAFGREHVMDVIETFTRIQRELFPEHELGAAGYLRAVIKKKWEVDGLPLGYFYLPVEQGGLGLRNPMFEAFTSLCSFEDDPENEHDEDRRDPQELFKNLIEEDADKFEEARDKWTHEYNRNQRKFDTFFTLGQYTSFREHLLTTWGAAYGDMFTERTTFNVKETPSLLAKLLNSTSFSSEWNRLDWYRKWVISVYGEDLVRKFGGFEIVDSKLIPIGMVKLFKDSRIKLDQ
ncbi:hypothetical protein NP233_g3119 [Leucocoprinus birnbaumii]|uniref:Reverse transcriptase domain-containing protein n=1 Tax=Leucocoprinus birnbaumii TaxID=56174 RepID=A0AAD5VXM6_9AGAR|nr:hypothetical protein NP233_g3119 [Leucocoprinus birnbaumii]